MTIKKRPSLRDNITGDDGSVDDETTQQLEQAAALERLRRGDEADPPVPAPAAEAAPADIPSADNPPADIPLPAAPVAEATPTEETVTVNAPRSALDEAPSPVAALAHAYLHGPSDAPPARRGGNGLATTAIVLAVLAAGAAVSASVLWTDDLREIIAPSPLSPRIAALEKAVGASAGVPLAVSVATLERSVAALDGRLAEPVGGSQVAGVLAMRQLRVALAGSEPFFNELALVRLSHWADPESMKALDRIAGRAAEGVLTRDQLTARFALLVPAVLNAELGESNNGIGETMWGWVTGAANALRLPVSETVPVESQAAPLLARAGLMLEAGDLSGAVERLSLLQGALAEAAAPWQAEARARIAVDQANTLLGNRVATLLAGAAR